MRQEQAEPISFKTVHQRNPEFSIEMFRRLANALDDLQLLTPIVFFDDGAVGRSYRIFPKEDLDTIETVLYLAKVENIESNRALTTDEVAEVLGCSAPTIRLLVKDLDRANLLSPPCRPYDRKRGARQRVFGEQDFAAMCGVVFAVAVQIKRNFDCVLTLGDLAELLGFPESTIRSLVRDLDKAKLLGPTHRLSTDKPRIRPRVFGEQDFETIGGVIYAAADQKTRARAL